MKAWEPKELTVSYHQITVHPKGEKPPVINWTKEAMKNGFAIAEGAVSFQAPVNAKAVIEVSLDVPGEVWHSDRHISVPFELKQDGLSIQSDMTNKLDYDLPPGSFLLTCYIIPLEVHLIKYLFAFQSLNDENSAILG
ncbi:MULTISPECIES: competence protein ComJ [Bacillus]|uniref:Uncharacterized protein n=2 Tax=Bacillus TaxID=1386 RepID=A0A0M4G5Y3_9BACI|nr:MULTISPECIES: competence protein ComJ [Bacillus]ALC80178.1 hypothetical protein AM592_00110 [Bacillus gobiensis]MBP1082845.1 hypothetical protein [Bacillus capparidis]MED1098485.1 competence protein ComJ [Bacillus capparidis]